MISIKAARRFIEKNPDDPDSRVLADLVLALENESVFRLADLYGMHPKRVDLALGVLSDWRLDRYYLGKAKLFDVSWQHRDLRSPADN